MLRDSLSKFFKVDNLISNLTGYIETKVELIKVEAREDLAEGLGKAATYLIILFVFSLVVLFLSLGVAVALANVVGDFWGYGIVAGFYLMIGIVLFAKRDSLNKGFEKKLLKNLKKKK
jgi:uncharacterized membrane protein YqjE